MYICIIFFWFSGISTIEEGTLDGHSLKLSSTNIGRISFAKEPQVKKLERTIKLLDENTLEQVIFMETSNTPLTKHLEVRYKKVVDWKYLEFLKYIIIV